MNELSISPVFSAEGTLTHFVGIQTDISERRKMADTLKAVLDTVGEGIVSAANGKVGSGTTVAIAVTSGGGVAARGGAFEDPLTRCDVSLRKPHSGGPDAVTSFRLVRELG